MPGYTIFNMELVSLSNNCPFLLKSICITRWFETFLVFNTNIENKDRLSSFFRISCCLSAGLTPLLAFEIYAKEASLALTIETAVAVSILRHVEGLAHSLVVTLSASSAVSFVDTLSALFALVLVAHTRIAVRVAFTIAFWSGLLHAHVVLAAIVPAGTITVSRALYALSVFAFERLAALPDRVTFLADVLQFLAGSLILVAVLELFVAVL